MMNMNLNQFLPNGVISDILTRLPAETVLESKLVCTTWNNLIHHPSFRKMHLARFNHRDTGKLSYVIAKQDEDVTGYDYNNRLFYFEYNENEDWNTVKPICRRITIKTSDEKGFYMCIGSFNGLICIYRFQLSSSSYGPAIVINPVTREYIVLPEFDSCPEYDHLAIGFGYLAETSEYKVVRIYKYAEEPTVVEVEVYTVGSGKGWRHVGKFDVGFVFRTHFLHSNGVFLNGCLHWRNTHGGAVVIFDLADEKFRQHIPPPPILMNTNDDADIDGFIQIGVSGGGILYYAVCQFINAQKFQGVWLFMKMEEHQPWGWIKVTSLHQRQPFAFMEDGTVIRYDQGNVKIFVSETSTWESNVSFAEISRQVFPHQHTLVSLKELGEEDAQIMEDNSESDND